jgi:initiation factor 1A
MPKNIKGGNKTKKTKAAQHRYDSRTCADMTPDIDAGQQYGLIAELLGNRRVRIICQDKIIRVGMIPGSFRRQIIIRADDVVIVSVRDFQTDKCDILHKFLPPDDKTHRDEHFTKYAESNDINFANTSDTDTDSDDVDVDNI